MSMMKFLYIYPTLISFPVILARIVFTYDDNICMASTFVHSGIRACYFNGEISLIETRVKENELCFEFVRSHDR